MLPRKHILTTSILAPLFLFVCAPALVASSNLLAAEAEITPPLSSPPKSPAWPPSPLAAVAESSSTQQAHHHHHQPAAVRKMSPDASEKFYHYDDPLARSIRGYFSPQEALSVLGAGDMASGDEFLSSSSSFELRAPHYQASLPGLFKRQFSCPVNHYACDSINAPTSCCKLDEQCIQIQDTGMGTAACCPNGSQCQGQLTSCNADQVTCTDHDGGGCCIDGYSCSRRGCIPDNSVKVASVTGALPPPVPTATCPTGFYSCASSLSGGCCRVGRGCGVTDCPANTTGPTSVGEDAKISGVPPPAPTGNCQTGWSSCGPSVNGGCCPTGYACGVSNCPATYLPGILPAETKRMPANYGGKQSTGARALGVVNNNMVKEVVVVMVVAVLMGI